MKKVVVGFAVFGMVSGLLFAVGPFVLGTPDGSLASFLVPVVLGLLVLATHRLNWKRLRDSGSRYQRGRLLAFNLGLLVFFLIGLVGMHRISTVFPHDPLRMIAFLVLWPLPLAVNAAYLCTHGAARLAQ